MILPFAVLLALIALGPLFFSGWWGRHYAKVALAFAAVTLTYYLGWLGAPGRARTLGTAEEYFRFICLIGSLYIVSGGIHITVKGESTPLKNVLFLLFGAVLANFLGTTGASMLLIRPWLRTNKYRITAHHVVFFIFIVSNVGGCLTPIGDPPLFLGFLKGIPFWWVAEHCWPMWAVALVVLLAIFYVLDRRNFRRAARHVRAQETTREIWRFNGLANLFFLALILVAVFLSHPRLLREGLMITAALGSYFTTKRQIHESNDFDFHPVREVAILFIGIFATMMPALDWLQGNAGQFLGSEPHPAVFYWGSGVLSSVLDNAPTYLAFLSANFGLFVDADLIAQVQAHLASGTIDFTGLTGVQGAQIHQTLLALQKYHGAAIAAHSVTVDEISVCFLLGNASFINYILAISVGAVFFGANTYIGNGPNFMVKSIAEHQKVRTPGFLGYIFKFTLPYLLPVLLLIWWIFFRQ